MTNPYQPPSPDTPEQLAEYVKLVGITMRKNTYLVVQAIVIVLLVVAGSVLLWATVGKAFGIDFSYIGIACLVLGLLEVGETMYAIKHKTFTK